MSRPCADAYIVHEVGEELLDDWVRVDETEPIAFGVRRRGMRVAQEEVVARRVVLLAPVADAAA